jgi:hypothetical protein
MAMNTLDSGETMASVQNAIAQSPRVPSDGKGVQRDIPIVLQETAAELLLQGGPKTYSGGLGKME